MTVYQNIVFITDGADSDAPALLQTVALAKAHGARLSLLSVIGRHGALDRLAEHSGRAPDQVAAELREARKTAMQVLADGCGAGLNIDVTVRGGKDFIEIIRQVISEKHDLLVKPMTRFAGLLPQLFASIDQHLLRKCPCPVWLVPADPPAAIRRIVAAVDVDMIDAAEPETQAALNRRIVDHAARIASFAGAELHLVHAWEAPAEGLLRQWGSDDNAVQSYLQQESAAASRALDQLVGASGDRIAPDRLHKTLLNGAARQTIPKKIASLGADLLVIGTVGRTGIPGFIIGNTAEDVLNSVTCAVMTIKPPGYESLVK